MAHEVPQVPKGLGDFRNSLFLLWAHLGLPSPTKRQYEIAHWLQHGPDRLIVEGFRGVGKSWITSALADWFLLNHPDWNILVVSASKVRADEFSIFSKRLIQEVPWLSHLRPTEDQRDSNIAWDVGPAPASHAPSVKSIGITGQITGSRADVIIADDIETSQNSLTLGMREKILKATEEFESVLKPGGRIIYLGTPHTEDSLYTHLERRGYTTRIWPARYPGAKLVEFYGDRLSPAIAEELSVDGDLIGQPTDPDRFGEFDLQDREAAVGRSTFALQFMLDTSLADSNRYPLKLSDMILMDLDREVGPQKVVYASGPQQEVKDVPNVGLTGDRYYAPLQIIGDLVPWQGSLLAIDPSGRGQDECAWTITKMLNGQIALMAWGGFLHGYSEATLQELALIAKRYKVNHCVYEANFGDGMFGQLFQPVLGKIHPCTVEEVKHSTQKEKRIIDTLEPVLCQHKLLVDKQAVRDDEKVDDGVLPEQRGFYRLMYQLTRCTREKGCLVHDDRLDCLAIAVAYWLEQLGADADDALRTKAKEDWDRELDEMLDRQNYPSSWMGHTLRWGA